jgi:hypothetical protein
MPHSVHLFGAKGVASIDPNLRHTSIRNRDPPKDGALNSWASTLFAKEQ